MLDRAGEIEKVSEAVIEQENKLRERKAFGLDGGFNKRQRSFEGNLINSLKKDSSGLGMDTLRSKRTALEDRSNYYMAEQKPTSGKNNATIDKSEFIKNAVNSIQLPPTHAFLGEN